MFTLTKQELFKLVHKKSTWITTIFLLIIQIGFSVFAKNNPHSADPLIAFRNGYEGFILIVFFIIAASATIISTEFEYGTIKELLYRKYSRGQVLVSKWITIFLYSLYWYILVGLVSLLLNETVYPKISLGQSAGHGYSYLTSLLAVQGANFLNIWLLVSLVFLLANVFNNSAVAVSVGIVGYFIVSVASTFITGLVAKWSWLKWNPLNMLEYPVQINEPSLSHVTKLSLNQLAAGNLVYIVIFLALGYLVFKKRNV